MAVPDGLVETVHQLVAAAREENLSVMAAGLAYHAFNSLIPAVLLVFASVAYAGELPGLASLLAATTGAGQDAIGRQLQQLGSNHAGQLRAVVIAGLIFLWSATRLFYSIRTAFTEVYGYDGTKSRATQVVNAAIAFATMATALVAITLLGATLANEFTGILVWVVTPLLLVVVLFVVFFPMYYLFPYPSVNVREAIPGTTFAAVAWALSGVGFRLYASTSQSVQLYGVAGGILLLLTWLYVGGFILLFGVTLNGVVAGRIDPG